MTMRRVDTPTPSTIGPGHFAHEPLGSAAAGVTANKTAATPRLQTTGISNLATQALATEIPAAQIVQARSFGLDLTISPAQQKVIDDLTPQQKQGLAQIGSALATVVDGDAKKVTEGFGDFIQSMRPGTVPTDVNALVQAVLRQSYMETTKDLYHYAEKVKYFNNLKQGIRDELAKAREAMAAMAGKPDTAVVDPPFFGTDFVTDFMGGTDVISQSNVKQFETVDTVFTSANFIGDRAGAGSTVDPVAIRLGDGPAVIETPDGSFVVQGNWVTGPTLTTGYPDNWTDKGGLVGLGNQILAYANDGDPSNDKFVPSLNAPRNPDGTMGFWDGSEPKPTMADMEAWISQEIDAGRIQLSDTVKNMYNDYKQGQQNGSGQPPFSSLTAGIVNVTIQYYEEQRTTTWFGPDMGILVLDRNNDGQVQNTDLFGDNAMTGRGTSTGYEDMALLDVNGDGYLSAADGENFTKLQVWQDLDSDGKVGPGEMKALAELGITQLSVVGNTATSGEAGVLQTSSAAATDIVTKADLETYITNLEEKLSTVGDDAQLANVDLQNVLQKQQQTMQSMSNISKMLHDTAMAVVRKIGG